MTKKVFIVGNCNLVSSLNFFPPENNAYKQSLEVLERTSCINQHNMRVIERKDTPESPDALRHLQELAHFLYALSRSPFDGSCCIFSEDD